MSGIYSDSVTYTDGTGNYNNASKTVKSYVLKASVTITGTAERSGYYGPMTAGACGDGTVTGVGGWSSAAREQHDHTNAGIYSDTVTFLATQLQGGQQDGEELHLEAS